MKTEKAVIETFWWNVRGQTPAPVQVAKVPDSVECTTGTIIDTQNDKRIVLYSKRRVRNPEPGYRYHEFRYR